ncbi:GumC family protein [Parabacteroides bouchesdurhonensis]|uniref:GumC family protein n=1 Tax=Parabacteroides bouchesdurhonensis TaxID=1936995 RepID=UPI000E4B5803|nr:GNVR domain-containing protein [Parabacteroides bouchesdurhonensis]RHJ95240.1 tyrosine protein kinase [Bacteroides sp. AM07-16]
MSNKVVDNETVELKNIIVYYIHQWKYFVCAFVVSIILAILYLLLYPKTYEMYASVQLQENKDLVGGGISMGEASGLMKSFGLSTGGSGGINIDDEIMAFSSNALFTKMILELGINVAYTKPFSWHKLYTNSPLIVTADSATMMSLEDRFALKVSVDAKGNITVKSPKRKDTFSSLPARLELPQGVFTLDFRNGPKTSFDLDILIQPVRWVAENMINSFTIEEVSKLSNMLEFTCDDHEKQRGIDILTTLVRIYNEQSDSYNKAEARKMITFLDSRIAAVIDDLNKTERAIEEYKLKNKMTAIEYDVQMYSEQMKELQSKIIEMEAESQVVNLMDAYVKKPENKYNLVPLMLSQDAEGSPLIVYNDALLERNKILQNSSADNPLVLQMNEKLDRLRENVFLTIANARAGMVSTLTDLRNKEQQLLNRMGAVPVQERVYVEFKRQQEITQAVYLLLLQKREEQALSMGLDQTKAKLIDEAFVKQYPVGPRKLYAGLFIIVFTLIIPVGVLFLRDRLKELISAYKQSV